MKTLERSNAAEGARALSVLCVRVRELVGKGRYRECEALIAAAMGEFPHAPQPHNLIGVVLEKMGDSARAMRHFRAAWALHSTYLPARSNLDRYASFYPRGACAFDEADCPGGTREKRDMMGTRTGALVPIGEGLLSVEEVPVAQTAPITGKQIWEIDLPPDAIIACVLRGEQAIVPRGNTRILAGDVLILICAQDQKAPAMRKLTGRP